MTNYNNGQIHGWNGGECPVHPKTVVRVWFRSGGTSEGLALVWDWAYGYSTDIVAFRVVKPYVEPKVIWVNEYRDELVAHPDEQSARAGASIRHHPQRIAVKYVEARDD